MARQTFDEVIAEGRFTSTQDRTLRKLFSMVQLAPIANIKTFQLSSDQGAQCDGLIGVADIDAYFVGAGSIPAIGEEVYSDVYGTPYPDNFLNNAYNAKDGIRFKIQGGKRVGFECPGGE